MDWTIEERSDEPSHLTHGAWGGGRSTGESDYHGHVTPCRQHGRANEIDAKIPLLPPRVQLQFPSLQGLKMGEMGPTGVTRQQPLAS